MKTISPVIWLFFYVLIGCGGSSPEDEVLLPTNLQTTITQSTTVNGKINVVATASNANFYTLYFGEVENETPVKVSNGIADYTYAKAGTYTLRTRAHATNDKFIESESSVTIAPVIPVDDIIPATGYRSPTSYPGLNLVWEDEFNGTSLNNANWTAEIGTGSNGWGNNELQYYRAENTTVRDGHLIITAKKESFSGSQYTSSRLITKDKKTFQYGRVDIRAALPKGQGMWPALWMLGNNISSVGWPRCGEIDIMEMIGGAGRENTVHGTLHWDNNGTHACSCGQNQGYSLSTGTFNDEFHVFSIVWNATGITWYVDNIQYNFINTTPAELSEFNAPFFFIFNVAVGGNWPGNPDATTVFPQHLVVDYIRVFQ